MTGLRERQKAGRRRDILAAAAKLFRRDGFAVTSIEAIAAEAEVAAGTVYNYFASKGDLLIALVALDGEEVRAAGRKIIANPPKDPVQAVTKLLTFYIDHALIHLSKELWRNAMANALSQPSSPFGLGYAELDRKLADQAGELVASLQERGQIDAGIDAKTAGDVLFEVVNSLFMVFVAREQMPIALLKKRLTRQVRLVFAGLGTAKAAE
jgi:AcrR family transcriptional regulator